MTGGGRSKFIVIAMLTLTFAAGAAVGVAGDRMAASESPERESNWSAARSGTFTIEKYAAEIGLTDSQKKRIAPILNSVLIRMESLADEIRPRASAISDTAKAQIKEILTPEQARKYEVLLAEREALERKYRESRLKHYADDGEAPEE